MLGQVESRAGELAVRSALGADRSRLTQQLVAEALLIGLLAGAAGAALAAASFRVLVQALPLGAWAESATLDWSVFWMALGLAVVASLAVVLVPSISLWRGDLQGALTRLRATAIGGRGGRVEGGLVIAEVALAVLLAAGAGLLIRSVTKLYAIDPGVETEGVAVVDITMGADLTRAQRLQSVRELATELGALPGVQSASAVQKLPLRRRGDSFGIGVEGRPDLAPSTTYFRVVEPRYFETMGIAVRKGRSFEASDRPDGEPVVVINEALAAKYFPGEEPLGRRLQTFDGFERIVGVVENVAEGNLVDEAVPARYMLAGQIPYTPDSWTLVLRTARAEDAVGLLEPARRVVQRIAPGIAVRETTTLEQVLDKAVGPARQIMALLSLLTGLALVLGAIGVYGVISHFVSRRKRDWGIRIALGQTPSRVVTQVVGRGASLVSAGVVLGLAGVVVLSRLLVSLLYGVGTADPLALAAASAALLVVGLTAAYIPAYRASRVDPASVLREQ
jgi:putative ABC transport system permease protein